MAPSRMGSTGAWKNIEFLLSTCSSKKASVRFFGCKDNWCDSPSSATAFDRRSAPSPSFPTSEPSERPSPSSSWVEVSQEERELEVD